MIELNFQLNEEWLGNLANSSPELVRNLLDMSFFFGKQTFVVNGTDLSSGRFPILWFAWHLRRIVQWINSSEDSYQIEGIENTPPFLFSKVLEGIQIEKNRPENGPYYRRAVCQPQELATCIKPYVRRVYRKCAKIYPAMETDKEFKEWLFKDYEPGDNKRR